MGQSQARLDLQAFVDRHYDALTFEGPLFVVVLLASVLYGVAGL